MEDGDSITVMPVVQGPVATSLSVMDALPAAGDPIAKDTFLATQARGPDCKALAQAVGVPSSDFL